MRIITFNNIKDANLDKEQFYNWTKETFLKKNSYILPPKTSMKFYDGLGFVNVMPTILPDQGVYGVKVVSRNPDSIPTLKSSIMFYDLNNNNLLSIMDADYITAFRTGATATLAIETLAVEKYESVAFIGLGNICRAICLMLANHVRRNLKFKLYLYENTDNGLIDLLKEYNNIQIETFDNIKDTIINSDVVVSCVTYAANDLAKPEWFKEGCLLVPVHTRGFMNCDLEFDRIIVDDKAHVCEFKNYDKFKICHELTDVLLNSKYGRQNNRERIIAYNIGLSILDIAFAKKIFDLLKSGVFDTSFESSLKRYWVK